MRAPCPGWLTVGNLLQYHMYHNVVDLEKSMSNPEEVNASRLQAPQLSLVASEALMEKAKICFAVAKARG